MSDKGKKCLSQRKGHPNARLDGRWLEEGTEGREAVAGGKGV